MKKHLDCIRCHDGLETYGEDFDHVGGFPLVRNHQEAACIGCHAGAASLEMLKSTTQNCADCHVDANAGELSQTCSFYHSPEGWDQMVFYHKITPFSLVGKHEIVSCQSCHSRPSEQSSGQHSQCHNTSGFGDGNEGGDHEKDDVPR